MAIGLDGAGRRDLWIAGESAVGMVGVDWSRNRFVGDVVPGAGDDQACFECHQTGYVVHRIDYLADQDHVGDWTVADGIPFITVGTAGSDAWIGGQFGGVLVFSFFLQVSS